MREVVAVCRSEGKARITAARVLDRYLWRIGDRTWRGRASNQCLQRIATDLRKGASRKMAVTLHGFATGEAGAPLFNIGSRRRFNPAGHAPIATSNSAAAKTSAVTSPERSALRIAALFHDLGKASRLFQAKLARALAGERGAGQSDPVRHEILSALIWDELTRDVKEEQLTACLTGLKAEDMSRAWVDAARTGATLPRPGGAEGGGILPLAFADRCDAVGLIGRLILTHHRLPGLSATRASFTSAHHVSPSDQFDPALLEHAEGRPLWDEPRWLEALRRESHRLQVDRLHPAAAEFELRTALILADKHGSASKRESQAATLLANTVPTQDLRLKPADDLLTHTLRVADSTRSTHEALVRARDLYPAIDIGQLPSAMQIPAGEDAPRYAWQGRAARAAAVAAAGGGGFFACLMAGTGSGKTRAAPLVLAAAASADPLPARRRLRFTLGLGLRSLATQSGHDLISDLGLAARDVQVLLGTPPLEFHSDETTGSDDALAGLSAADIVTPETQVPEPGATCEADWLQGLSHDPDRQVPHALQMLAAVDPDLGGKLLRLAQAPILCTTIDHVITAASPFRTSHIPGALRVITSDLILDEVDQFAPEDCAVLGRLVWLAGLCGRRVVILSATVNATLGPALARAYAAGWRLGAERLGLSPQVNFLFTSDGPETDACQTSTDSSDPAVSYNTMCQSTLSHLARRPPQRRAEILGVTALADVPAAVSAAISKFHDRHHTTLEGFHVSFGFARMTRISHVVALARSLPPAPGRLRLMVVLHSRMKRAVRGWIEHELKRALSRKAPGADAGLHNFCTRHDVFRRASTAGVKDIELVLICSPVVETGNDLDFDYGIMDPGSVRAVVQAAGRVNRHRAMAVNAANVALLSWPLVALENGRLAYPGVETPLHKATRVGQTELNEGRDLESLYAGAMLSRLDAAWVLEGNLPLQRQEDAQLRAFVADADLGIDVWHSSAMTRSSSTLLNARRFRRATLQQLELFCATDRHDNEVWLSDDGLSLRKQPVSLGAHIAMPRGEFLFDAPFQHAVSALWPGGELSPTRLRIATSVSWPQWSTAIEDWASVAYSEQLGLSRIAHHDLMMS